MSDLDRLAESHGIQIGYISEMGERKIISDQAKRSLLGVLGIDPDGADYGGFDEAADKPHLRCALPEDLFARKAWGATCQLYSLRSRRSLGLGDFEDLARFAEIAAEAGAAFVGVNPLHALFFADGGRFGPYSPSTRRFLSPAYLALDKLKGGPEAVAAVRAEEPAAFSALDADLVDYPTAVRLKHRILHRIFAARREEIGASSAFERYVAGNGDPLRDFALFEAISAKMVTEGHHAGWHSWPDEWRRRDGATVRGFEDGEGAEETLFHLWLQYLCDEQLAEAQARAKGAGMRIGLYLDLAVGVAPDGAETWADPELTVGSARVGSPPDMFNSSGQDWGLAPQSPTALAARDYRPLGHSFDALTRHAGAVRIDHAMGLARLWWIAEGHPSAEGGYIRYPLGRMVDTIAKVSVDNGCIVIGEDLGTVPPGFRHTMSDAGILSYRVLYFERRGGAEFLDPAAYPASSLACVSTHDLPTLKGWWDGTDVELRAAMGTQNAERSEAGREERKRDRRALVVALKEEGVLPERYDRVASGEDPLPARLEQDMADAVHRFVARTPSVLVAIQIEDMIGSERQPNLPGTTDQYPNWRIRLPVFLEELAAHPGFQSAAAAMRSERP
ncbi:4-alpha-glucanotransferase [Aureimonas endophytica]|uniref:4-alpha-glucanotransferase n=1 Tax=Aureimonas endophytica TaxID=2027858 RepID=A0A917A1D7_9HYPH|nr:4-alpha-glucanotransferase [Aureimonas endophytica]GGE20873.1 4-alpha-glucanotransferase [Aureimonas endophytica]